ncbi:MAG: putative Ig domain-containing protein, partial [Burkholderiales bacterium]
MNNLSKRVCFASAGRSMLATSTPSGSTFRSALMKLAVLCVAAMTTTVAHAQPYAYVPLFSGGLYVQNLATNFAPTTVALGTNPFGIALNPAGTRAYITNNGGLAVSVVDTSTNTSIATINVGNVPTGIAVTPDGNRVYSANQNDGTVSVINTSTDTVTTTVTVGAGPVGVAVHPDGSRVYVANFTAGTVSVINTSTNTVTATITLGAQPYGVAINAAGTRAYVTNYGANNVSVIDTTNNSVLTTVSVGSGPTGIAVQPGDARVYVSNTSSGSISVIDTASNLVVANITQNLFFETTPAPRGLSFSSTGGVLYAATGGYLIRISTRLNQVMFATDIPGAYAIGNFVTSSDSAVAPVITSGPPPAATAGSFYSFQLVASGTLPNLWRIAGGTLPSGMDIDASNGLLVGTPTTPGSYSFTVEVDNGVGTPATQNVSLTVNAAPSPNCVFNSSTGSWTDPSKWSGVCGGSRYPAANDVAEIANATVTLPSGSFTVRKLNLSGTVSFTGDGDPSTSIELTDYFSNWGSAIQVTLSQMKLTLLGGAGLFSGADFTLNNASLDIESGASFDSAGSSALTVNGSTSVLRNAGDLWLDGNGASFINGAQMVNETSGTISNNFAAFTIDGPFENRGIFNAAMVELVNAAQYTQTNPAARLRVSGKLSGLGTLTIGAGRVESYAGGLVTLDFSNVVNNGAKFKPVRIDDGLTFPATMTILGNYTQGVAGQLELAWCDVSDYDKLNVLGNVTLDGEIGVMLGSNCVGEIPVPSPGDVIDAVLFANNGRTGTFATLTPPSGYNLTANYSATDRVRLIFVGPELTISPTNFNFGNQLVGSTSSPLTGTISNTGGSSITFRGSPPEVPTTPFAVDLTNCLGTTLAPSQGCSYSVTFSPTALTSSTVDLLPHISAAVQTPAVSISNSTLMASGTGVAPAAPSVALAFSPPTRNVSVPTTLTVTLTNTNSSTMNGADFVLTYPSGLVNSASPNATSTCGTPVVAAVAGGNTLTFSSGTVPPTGNCTVTVSVVSSTAGVYNVGIPIGAVTTVSFGSNTAAASAVFVVSTPGSAPWQSDRRLAGGGTAEFALRESGEVWSWGVNNGDALGRANNTVTTPSPITTLGNSVRSVAGAAWYGVALKTDGSVWAWGSGSNVGAGVGLPAAATVPLPLQVTGISGAVGISTRYHHTLALKGDGTVWGFGREDFLALGPTIGNKAARQVPSLGNVRQVAAGEQHSLALVEDGTVLSWGSNTFGQLGVFTSGLPQPAPQTVPISNVVQITSGSFTSLALKSDGTVWRWGNATPGGSTPTQVAGLSGVVSIAAGNYTFFALLSNGTVMGWGDNSFGRVG